jgi:hypothetical protein
MKKFILLFIILSLTTIFCSKKQITEEKIQHISPEADKLHQFFTICKSDIKKAVKVISDNKMIAVLTHLKKMDMEGRKYYLLERENLTDMIKSVTEGTYSDLILVNNSGVIIYTMINDEIFGKSVKHHYKDTALNACFNKSTDSDLYINDVSFFPVTNGSPKLFVSLPDKIDNYVRGIFIIQIDVEIIEKLMGEKITIIGQDGKLKISKNREAILTGYIYWDKLNIININNVTKQNFEVENKKYIYYPYNFNTLSWIVISEN